MFQPSGFAARFLPEIWRERLEREGLGPRALGFGAALLIEALLLLLLLSLNQVRSEPKPPVVVAFRAHDVEEEKAPAPEPSRAAAAQPQAQRTVTPPPPPATVPSPQPQVTPAPMPVPVIPLPRPFTLPAAPAAGPSAAPAQGPAYGPADSGGGSGGIDSQRVGTAPNGEPMYAATWYTKPTDSQLRGYLSTASGPGSALITCRTVADYRVEDCVGLSEFPEGSQILRSVLAAAWQFRVRPPRRGGQVLVGAWVRIRIDYDVRRGPSREDGN